MERAQRLLTRRALIAFDLDKTVLHQGQLGELETFTSSVCQTLIDLASQGYNISAVTGNDMHQLSCRFAKSLIEELCRHRRLQLLEQFSCFCNCATVYVRFSGAALTGLVAQQGSLELSALQELASSTVFHQVDGLLEIRPGFVVQEYVARTCMGAAEAADIERLAQAAANEWWAEACTADGDALRPELCARFFVNTADAEANSALALAAQRSESNREAAVYEAFRPAGARGSLALAPPVVERRDVRTAEGACYSAALTIKPILSFRHARSPSPQGRGLSPEEDARAALIGKVQRALRDAGLSQYVATAGGRSSIDIMKQRVNKRYAVSYLIETLDLLGIASEQEEEGTNVIFFGDEVVMNGNDLCVADIPGILVFAVNPRRERVPLNAQILLPSTTLQGPDATDAILRQLHVLTADLLCRYESWLGAGKPGLPRPSHVTAVRAFKEDVLSRRVLQKAQTLVADLDRTSLPRLFAANSVLSALARPGRESIELAGHVQRLVDMTGDIAVRIKESEFDVVSMGALGESYFERPPR